MPFRVFDERRGETDRQAQPCVTFSIAGFHVTFITTRTPQLTLHLEQPAVYRQLCSLKVKVHTSVLDKNPGGASWCQGATPGLKLFSELLQR